jgi:hypothetical protein
VKSQAHDCVWLFLCSDYHLPGDTARSFIADCPFAFALFTLCIVPLDFWPMLGTASAEEQDGKHANKRAPAANSSLSAASRCASRPPSDPSV